jgi:phage tail-like protein
MPGGLPGLSNDAIGGSHFALETDGIQLSQFQEVTGITQEREVTTIKENGPDGMLYIKQMPGPPKPPTITLKRAANMDKSMADWYEEAKTKIGSARRNGSITCYDFEGSEVARWNFYFGWPSKLEVTGLKAAANEAAIETVTITAESIERVK